MLNEMLNSGLHVEEDARGIGWLTLDRPNTSNAINPALATDLSKFIEALSARASVRVVVLQGRGKNFCAGFDLNHVGDVTGGFDQALSIQRLMSGLIAQMRRIPQPIIAAVQGAASGAGFALALAADVRIATPAARMNVAMARIGLTGCDMGTSYFLPRLVGRSVAAELMMTGRFIDAARALQLGLVSEVVPAAELNAHVLALAEDMLRMSPAGLQLTKEGLEAAQDAASLEQVLALEDRGQLICIKQYMQEGVAAFREKRAPNYSR
jgi:enoyl-CoA hydratase/carnithine racemase